MSITCYTSATTHSFPTAASFTYSIIFGCDQTRRDIRPPALPAIVPNIVCHGICTPKGQIAETKIEFWELFFDNAMLESITDFTNIKMGLLRYLFQGDRDTKEMDVVEMCTLFGLLYMAGIMHAPHMNIDDFCQTDGTGIEFFRLVIDV